MSIEELGQEWDALARTDPLWYILTHKDKVGNRWGTDEFFAIGEEEADWLVGYADRVSGGELRRGTALDFGCGVGRVTGPLAARFERAIGIDVSEVMVELARRHHSHRSNCEFMVNCRDDLDVVESDSVDLLYSKLTLQHMETRHALAYMREFIRVVRPGGLAVFQVIQVIPEPVGAWDRLRRRVRGYRLERRRLAIEADRLARHAPAEAAEGAPLRMQTNPMPRGELLAAIAAAGGVVRHERVEPSPDPDWESHTYAVAAEH
jgi:SAM-dependent methyltransferase